MVYEGYVVPLIWVTGANGQVGCAIQQWIKQHFSWTVRFFLRKEFDLTNEASMQLWFIRERPSCIINLAAFTLVDKAEIAIDEAYAVNAVGVAQLAKLCAQYHVPVIHVSTDYVFSGQGNIPYEETYSIAPKSIYGQSKAQGEIYLRTYHFEHIILRTSWVFSSAKDSFVTKILRKGYENGKVSVVSDQIGCPTSAKNLAVVLCQLAEAIIHNTAIYGTYHYRDDTVYSWYTFTQRIFDLVTQRGAQYEHMQVFPVSSDEYPTPASRPKYSVLSVDKLTRNYGISPLSCDEPLQTVVKEVMEKIHYV